MIESEDVLLVIGVVFAVYFTEGALDFPTHDAPGEENLAGKVSGYVRMTAYPAFAAASWYVLQAMFGAANNCFFTFGATGSLCFADPTFTTPTLTVVPEAAADPLFWFSEIMVYAMGLLFVFNIAFFLIYPYVKGNRSDRELPLVIPGT